MGMGTHVLLQTGIRQKLTTGCVSVWTENRGEEELACWAGGPACDKEDHVVRCWRRGKGWWVHLGKGKVAGLMERVSVTRWPPWLRFLEKPKASSWAGRLPEIWEDGRLCNPPLSLYKTFSLPSGEETGAQSRESMIPGSKSLGVLYMVGLSPPHIGVLGTASSCSQSRDSTSSQPPRHPALPMAAHNCL